MSGTICIVDDELAILHALSSILEEEGYQVTVAQTGREALRKSIALNRISREENEELRR